MDRNKIRIAPIDSVIDVALRKESVDRNLRKITITIDDVVALRKESVDRNPKLCQALCHVRWSLSARRAWIEIAEKA